jgi:hypothetical protein
MLMASVRSGKGGDRRRNGNCLPAPNYKKIESIYRDREKKLGKDNS